MRNGSNHYNAADLEVLRGLDPVKRRPGMYTDTTRPNHLAQEVIDNAVDEAIAGFADRIEVTHFKDGSLQVIDNGRGMPVDTHPEEKVSGAEVIMTRLHAGAKFGTKNYQCPGGRHGVGVSVVNALSAKLDVEIRRNGLVYQMSFRDGKKSSELKTIGKAPKSDTGTKVRFWPNATYFETTKFSLSRLRHTLRAKAVLCPRLTVTFSDEASGETQSWYFEDGLKDYLVENLQDFNRIPEEPFVGNLEGKGESVSWAVIWLPDGGDGIAESYANLIPTPQGGTHVAG
ncbi:MAG: DNA topoisomerase IV subunit B, partial [Syntrophobacterales bacterium]